MKGVARKVQRERCSAKGATQGVAMWKNDNAIGNGNAQGVATREEQQHIRNNNVKIGATLKE
jgi:hypothetical protein